MHVLQTFCYSVGTKIPFDKWPAIIEDYLQSQGLTHRAFHYYLECYDFSKDHRAILDGSKCERCFRTMDCDSCRKKAANALKNGSGCERAARENPFLGEIHTEQTEYTTTHYLSNRSDQTNSRKDAVLGIVSKLYRRYGFTNAALIYRDINFFPQAPCRTSPDEWPLTHCTGSGITLFRSCVGSENDITLTVASAYPGEVPDAAPYAEALSALLPGVKCSKAIRIVMNDAEKEQYHAWNQLAAPLVKQANTFFKDRMPEEKGNEDPATKVSVASILKKLCARHGYAYLGYRKYTYTAEKRVSGGHCIHLEFSSNPLSPDADPEVTLCGLGFRHTIWFDCFSPQNPKETTEYLTLLFDVLAEAETAFFPAILKPYPPTPTWFLPSDSERI